MRESLIRDSEHVQNYEDVIPEGTDEIFTIFRYTPFFRKEYIKQEELFRSYDKLFSNKKEREISKHLYRSNFSNE